MQIDGQAVKVQKWWIEECLKKRIEGFGVKIEDLFLIIRCPKGASGDTFLETSYGSLRAFFTDEMPENKVALILHTSKFPYPRKHNPINYLPDESVNYQRERIN